MVAVTLRVAALAERGREGGRQRERGGRRGEALLILPHPLIHTAEGPRGEGQRRRVKGEKGCTCREGEKQEKSKGRRYLGERKGTAGKRRESEGSEGEKHLKGEEEESRGKWLLGRKKGR